MSSASLSLEEEESESESSHSESDPSSSCVGGCFDVGVYIYIGGLESSQWMGYICICGRERWLVGGGGGSDG